MLRLLSPGSCIPHPPGHRLRRPRRRSKKSKRHRRRSSMLGLLNPGLHRLLLPGHRYRRLLRLNNRTSRRAVKNMSPQKVSLPQSHDRSVRSPFISVSVLSGGDTSGRGSNGVIKIVAPAFTRRSRRTASGVGHAWNIAHLMISGVGCLHCRVVRTTKPKKAVFTASGVTPTP
jgi:hypothetical protein